MPILNLTTLAHMVTEISNKISCGYFNSIAFDKNLFYTVSDQISMLFLIYLKRSKVAKISRNFDIHSYILHITGYRINKLDCMAK